MFVDVAKVNLKAGKGGDAADDGLFHGEALSVALSCMGTEGQHGKQHGCAEEQADNMLDALDNCVDSLIRQIRKNKTRLDKKLYAAALDDFFNDEIEEESEFDDDIVTLLSADGEEIDFFEIAGIVYEGNMYAILQPAELIEGVEDDEALVFKVTRDENGNDKFELELDNEIIDAVFEKYNELLNNYLNEE